MWVHLASSRECPGVETHVVVSPSPPSNPPPTTAQPTQSISMQSPPTQQFAPQQQQFSKPPPPRRNSNLNSLLNPLNPSSLKDHPKGMRPKHPHSLKVTLRHPHSSPLHPQIKTATEHPQAVQGLSLALATTVARLVTSGLTVPNHSSATRSWMVSRPVQVFVVEVEVVIEKTATESIAPECNHPGKVTRVTSLSRHSCSNKVLIRALRAR